MEKFGPWMLVTKNKRFPRNQGVDKMGKEQNFRGANKGSNGNEKGGHHNLKFGSRFNALYVDHMENLEEEANNSQRLGQTSKAQNKDQGIIISDGLKQIKHKRPNMQVPNIKNFGKAFSFKNRGESNNASKIPTMEETTRPTKQAKNAKYHQAATATEHTVAFGRKGSPEISRIISMCNPSTSRSIKEHSEMEVTTS
ncbi:hypothetical protein M5689_000676 [Euphorbia peplus]|nr:hypothetical protein M5689_000676 [Euphorbia peplus]